MSSLARKRNMQLIRTPVSIDNRATAVAIGNFDGLHLGHAEVVKTMLRDAKAQQLVSAVLTFEPHPRRYFAPNAPQFRLETVSQKLHRLRAWGVERIYMPRFNAKFAAQTAEEFLHNILQQQLRAKVIVTGDNFAFGKNRAGNTELLRAWGKTHNITVHALPAVTVSGIICSSSAVRAALAEGDMQKAAALLGRPYQLTGRVVPGDKRGRELGFPTANIALIPGLKLPVNGIYAVRAELPNGQKILGAASLGLRPTVGIQENPTLEVYLFDFNRDIYGHRLTVQFISYIRPEETFDSLEAMKKQMADDCIRAKELLRGAA